jgi:hypothetical protein
MALLLAAGGAKLLDKHNSLRDYADEQEDSPVVVNPEILSGWATFSFISSAVSCRVRGNVLDQGP